MNSVTSHAIEDLMFSFLYPNRRQASRCNSKLQQLIQFDVIPELEKTFDQLGLKGIELELDQLEIDLGMLQEEDISIGLGRKISPLLSKALLDAIWEKMYLGKEGSLQNASVMDLYLLALQQYFLKGFLPVWLKSDFDVYSLLEFVFSMNPAPLKRMLETVIQQSESARKRIAFLGTGYFDQIIRVLAAADAEWMIGYRNTYLELHKSKNRLPGPEESLRKSLNLFILTYLSGKSGPKFNRLDFSERFLKSIAAHYNMTFEVFLSQINVIINNISGESNLFREFKETINTINEKNNPEAEWEEGPSEPTFLQLVQWLNVGATNTGFHSYLVKWKDSGVLFETLSNRFPGFWKSLSKKGLLHLLERLLDGQDTQWSALTHNYLKWYAQAAAKTNADDEVLKAIFSLTSRSSLHVELPIRKTDDWFMLLSIHAFTELDEHYQVSKALLTLGEKAGLANLGQLLISAKSRGSKNKNDIQVLKHGNDNQAALTDPKSAQRSENPIFLKNQLALLVLQQYLSTGMLSSSNRELSQSDLLWIVNNLLQGHDATLLDALSIAVRKNGNAFTRRFASITHGIDQKEFQALIRKYGAQKTLSLYQFNEKLLSMFGAYPRLENILNQKLWSLLLEENSSEQSKRSIVLEYRSAWEDEAFLSGISRLTEQKGFRIDVLRTVQIKMQFKKYVLLYFSRFSANEFLQFSAFRNLAHAVLTDRANQSILRPMLTEGVNQILKKGAIDSNEHTSVARYIKGISLNPDRLLELLQADSAHVEFKSLIFEKDKGKELKQTALKIVEQDLVRLFALSSKVNLGAYDKKDLLESSRRIILYAKLDKLAIIRLVEKKKKQLPVLLISLFRHLSKSDWQKFSLWFREDIVPGIGIQNPVQKSGIVVLNLKAFIESLNSKDELLADKFSETLEYLHESLSNSRALTPGYASLLPNSLTAMKGLEYLIGLPSSFFFKKSAFAAWRASIMNSIFQFHVLFSSNPSIKAEVFWEIFTGTLKKNSHKFGGTSMDWSSILNSRHLDEKAKVHLKKFVVQFVKKPMTISVNGLEIEQLSAAISYLKEEGYLPWWSPIQHKAKLLLAMLNHIQFSEKNDAFLLILLFEKGKIPILLQGLSENQLKRIYKVTVSSKYQKYFSSFIESLQVELDKKNANTAGFSKLENESSSPLRGEGHSHSKSGEKKDLKDMEAKNMFLSGSRSEVESWVRKKVNLSKENEVLSTWFKPRSEIMNELKTLLNLGSYMYFGNLNPGKWKIWLLVFAYDYYIQKANKSTGSFFNQFLQYLIKNKSEINWKTVFQSMVNEKRFDGKVLEVYKAEVLKSFPMLTEAIAQDPEKGELVKVSNAGLVLCWPFLSVLFSRLKISDKGLIPEESQSKAVYLLQYIVYGHTEFPEYEMVLNKLLIGMKVSQHLEKTELQQEEKDMAISLINGMKSNWEKMKKASPDAVRETFLQREGTLEFDSLGNTLRIPKTGVDVLLDGISWNISMVKLPWMEKSLEIKWR
ncbi:MAG: hypothetical protein EA341_13655 [Mongoliibacter sp.]|uniref:contractile injection system tape measure protein n=1 Tax=Mongoliibacter sp. TaxID=2022438 RepID=UPI0012F3FCC3|nr:contractile injection system tape measure protein [Mongoliibacter sp.]TVP46476.1 MAG: hypothetical protein EA341_13655 [Mongoliibacter sp.]